MAWDTGTFENGQYTVRVKADDAAGMQCWVWEQAEADCSFQFFRGGGIGIKRPRRGAVRTDPNPYHYGMF
jgi:hypothetical protein